MTNQELLEALKQGFEFWNEWRSNHPEIEWELSIYDLSGMNLSHYNLSGALLSGLELYYVQFNGANLSKADLSGAYLSGADLSGAKLCGTNLQHAEIHEALLIKSDLRDANLFFAELVNAKLEGAILARTNLRGAKLHCADLSHANLFEASLWGANLYETRLTGAYLGGTNFQDANLERADFTDAELAKTIFSNNDLSSTLGLDKIIHTMRSTIDINTIHLSKGNIPKEFLCGAGVPESLLSYAYSLAGQDTGFYSCFISYSSKDQTFAKRLYKDLQSKGISCWYAPENLRIGDKIRMSIDESIKQFQKLLLILSKNSLESRWVEKEVETAFEEEQKQKRIILFPIMLDNSVSKIEIGWPADIRRSRNIGDFRRWKEPESYQSSFNKLVQDLKIESRLIGST